MPTTSREPVTTQNQSKAQAEAELAKTEPETEPGNRSAGAATATAPVERVDAATQAGRDQKSAKNAAGTTERPPTQSAAPSKALIEADLETTARGGQTLVPTNPDDVFVPNENATGSVKLDAADVETMRAYMHRAGDQGEDMAQLRRKLDEAAKG